MREFFTFLLKYLRQRLRIILSFCLFLLLCGVIDLLYHLPLVPMWYTLFVVLVLGTVLGATDLLRAWSCHRTLSRLGREAGLCQSELPCPGGPLEEDYQQLICQLQRELEQLRSASDASRQEAVDYYTLWVHQIKTPISAMQLLLQSGQIDRTQLSQELFKVERYAEMVLQYLRLESLSSDLLLRPVAVGELIRRTVQKYAVVFIGRRISLSLEDPLAITAVTDEKWLGVVLEQLLSNALKYTPEGGSIRIYADPKAPETLVIQDTGIGILPEDLPRIFERGFTGHNGRLDQKSTGIGLYLCSRILRSLGHPISVESVVGQGSSFRISLSRTIPL